jgi:hypothetical protein
MFQLKKKLAKDMNCFTNELIKFIYRQKNIERYSKINNDVNLVFENIFIFLKFRSSHISSAADHTNAQARCEDLCITARALATVIELRIHCDITTAAFVDCPRTHHESVPAKVLRKCNTLEQGCTTQVSWRAKIFFIYVHGPNFIIFYA